LTFLDWLPAQAYRKVSIQQTAITSSKVEALSLHHYGK